MNGPKRSTECCVDVISDTDSSGYMKCWVTGKNHVKMTYVLLQHRTRLPNWNLGLLDQTLEENADRRLWTNTGFTSSPSRNHMRTRVTPASAKTAPVL